MIGIKRSRSAPATVALCCLVVLFLLIVALAAVYFAVLRPRDPRVEFAFVGLRQIQFQPPPNFRLNLSLDVDVAVRNPNFASFDYDVGTTLVFYRGALVGQAPVEAGDIGARSTETVRTEPVLNVAAMAADRRFAGDVAAGALALQSSTSLRGRVRVVRIFRRRASVFTACDIRVALFAGGMVAADCSSKVSS
ncbi:late embryogenesis abundant protein At1g64065-like [Curcuma longa]|uniref:late embryogenesis abundant protein At1g64065-like n=1 Tax=Curcuma longa TaxID=136217 RepID=UPI003D9ED15B